MSNIKRIILWPILGLSVFLQVACTATPIKLDTDAHTKLLQNDRKSLSHDKNLETKIKIDKKESCFGSHGEPTDGSFFNQKDKAKYKKQIDHSELKVKQNL